VSGSGSLKVNDGDNLIQPVDARDVARALMAIIDDPVSETACREGKGRERGRQAEGEKKNVASSWSPCLFYVCPSMLLLLLLLLPPPR